MSDGVWTAEQIRELGVRTDLETAAAVLGIGRSTAYGLARRGKFPCRALQVGRRWIVPVAGLLEVLGIPGEPSDHRSDARLIAAGQRGVGIRLASGER